MKWSHGWRERESESAHLCPEEVRVCMYPHQEGREGGYNGGVEVSIVTRLSLHGLRLYIASDQLDCLPAVSVVWYNVYTVCSMQYEYHIREAGH